MLCSFSFGCPPEAIYHTGHGFYKSRPFYNQSQIEPTISIGDTVRVFKKKDKLDKERVSNWSTEKYKVTDIQESMGQKFYKLEGRDKIVMRSELLLIDWTMD